ncbi:olfactory receptor 52D1-like [Discoglossus pictus]
MENMSTAFTTFVLLGLVEVEGFEYMFGALSLIIYLFIMLSSVMIVLVVLTDTTLHEPMYILICNLILNGIFGSTTFFPKLIIDLFTSSKMVPRAGCFIQALCVLSFALYEISTFTIMAYDRYLAVCHPLQYRTMMSNKKLLKLISGSLAYSVAANLIPISLSVTLPLCGAGIKNMYCDNMAIVNLSCVNTSVNNICGIIIFMSFLLFAITTIVYSYIQIFLICLKISKDASQKAIHTVVTHLLSFSIFMVGVLFIFIRYRLNSNKAPLVIHILFSATPIVLPPLFNPFIYGIRTKALRTRVIHRLRALHQAC